MRDSMGVFLWKILPIIGDILDGVLLQNLAFLKGMFLLSTSKISLVFPSNNALFSSY